MNLYILKNSEGLYWTNDNGYSSYPNAAKTYLLDDAKKAAKRKNCVVCIAKTKTINNKGEFFIEDAGILTD